jgi:hypothetical protein
MLYINNYSGDWNYTTLRPYIAGEHWFISMPSGIIPSGINVSGSYNIGSIIVATSGDNINAGDNSGWLFANNIEYLDTTTFISFVPNNSTVGIGTSYTHIVDTLNFISFSGTVPEVSVIRVDTGTLIFTSYDVEVKARVIYCEGPKFEYPDRASGIYIYPVRVSGNYILPLRISGYYNSPHRTTTCRWRQT